MKIKFDTNGRTQRMKQVVCSRYFVIGGILVVLLPVALSASTIGTNGMYHFVTGTPINPDEVNANFDHFANAISVKDGNVGIGTTSPATTLDVRSATQPADFWGSAQSQPFSILAGNTVESSYKRGSFVGQNIALDATTGLPLNRLGTYTSSAIGFAPYTGVGNSGIGFFTTAGTTPNTVLTEVMRIDKSGQVGIGTTSPGYKLDVDSGSTPFPLRLMSSAQDGGIRFENTSQGGRIYHVGSTGTSSGAGFGFSVFDKTANLARFLISDSGNVGIGTTHPDAKLHVRVSDDQNLEVLYPNDLGDGVRLFSRNNDGLATQFEIQGSSVRFPLNTGATGFIFNAGSGNVGIGTTNPAYKLEVNGAIHASGGVSVMGDVISDDYLYNSDARLKQDIAPLENASSGIACLQGVTYRWNDATAARSRASQDLQIGLIAQDVESCFPEVVSTSPDGYKSVSYARLVAPLIEAVKEQQTLIDQQTRSLAEQQRLNARQAATTASLEARLARLERMVAAHP